MQDKLTVEEREVALPRVPAPVSARQVGDRLRALVVSRELLLLLFALGAALRIRQYLANRSLWLDESFLAVNIIEHPIRDLFGPLQFNQAAPPGFLLVEKVATDVFGKSEYALRAFPLACGLISIVLFTALARRLIRPLVVPLAVAMFAVWPAHIYYSSEAKPYAVDVAVTLALLLVALELANGRASRSFKAKAGLLAALAIQVSAVGLFVVSAWALAVGIKLLLRRSWRTMRDLAVSLIPAVASGLLFLWIYSRNTEHYTFEGDVFAKLPTSGASISWWFELTKTIATLVGIYHSPLEPGAPIPIIAGFLAIIGAVRLRREHELISATVATTAFLIVAASIIKKYPLIPRTMLFLAPVLILIIASGASIVLERLRRAPLAALLILAAGLLGYQSYHSARDAAKPIRPEDIKWQLRFIASHWQRGDTLYLHYPTQFAFTYYDECACFAMPRSAEGQPLWPVKRAPAAQPWIQMPRALTPLSRRIIVGRFAGDYKTGIYQRDVATIQRHRRAWILFSHAMSPQEQRFVRRDLLKRLDERGRRIFFTLRPSSWLYLYKFRA
jgi:uncharacterized membrane protein